MLFGSWKEPGKDRGRLRLRSNEVDLVSCVPSGDVKQTGLHLAQRLKWASKSQSVAFYRKMGPKPDF